MSELAASGRHFVLSTTKDGPGFLAGAHNLEFSGEYPTRYLGEPRKIATVIDGEVGAISVAHGSTVEFFAGPFEQHDQAQQFCETLNRERGHTKEPKSHEFFDVLINEGAKASIGHEDFALIAEAGGLYMVRGTHPDVKTSMCEFEHADADVVRETAHEMMREDIGERTYPSGFTDLTRKGRFTGEIIEVTETRCRQDIGRGIEIAHELDAIDGPVAVGSVITVDYQNQRGIVVEKSRARLQEIAR